MTPNEQCVRALLSLYYSWDSDTQANMAMTVLAALEALEPQTEAVAATGEAGTKRSEKPAARGRQ